MLDVQIKCLSVDTGNFYSNKEAILHYKIHKLKMERNALKKKSDIIYEKLLGYGIDKSCLKSISEDEYDFDDLDVDLSLVLELCEKYFNIDYLLKYKKEKIKEFKNELLQLLSNKVEANITANGKHHIRELRNLNPSGNKSDVLKYVNEQFNDKRIISVFDSAFTRMIGAKQDELTEDFMVVQVYYFDVIKDLIYHGFTYKGEKYIYLLLLLGKLGQRKLYLLKNLFGNNMKKLLCVDLQLIQ